MRRCGSGSRRSPSRRTACSTKPGRSPSAWPRSRHQSVQDTKALLNQHLRASAVATLGYGLAAESQSHDTAEYQAVPDQFARRKG